MKFFAALFALFFATSAQAAPVSVEFMARLNKVVLFNYTAEPVTPGLMKTFYQDAVFSPNFDIMAMTDWQWRHVSISYDSDNFTSFTCFIGELDCSMIPSYPPYVGPEGFSGYTYGGYFLIEYHTGYLKYLKDGPVSGSVNGENFHARSADFFFETAPMPVPLPSSASLLLAGAGIMSLLRKRRS